MDKRDYAEKWAERESEAPRRINIWFNNHPDQKYYLAYYPLIDLMYYGRLHRLRESEQSLVQCLRYRMRSPTDDAEYVAAWFREQQCSKNLVG